MAQILVSLKEGIDGTEIKRFAEKWAKKGWVYEGVEYGFRQKPFHKFQAKGKREGIEFSGSKGPIESVQVFYD
jgi:hypothetical protein